MSETLADLEEIERIWAASSQGTQRRWRIEQCPPAVAGDDRVKLYAVNDPNMHDSYLLDLSAGDASYQANLEAIAKAPEHVAALLAEVKRLRAANAERWEAHKRTIDDSNEWSRRCDLLEEQLELNDIEPVSSHTESLRYHLEKTTENLRRANSYSAHLERKLEKHGEPIRIADLVEAQDARLGRELVLPNRPPDSARPPRAPDAAPGVTFASGAAGGLVTATTVSGPLSEPFEVSAGITPDVPAGALTITEDDEDEADNLRDRVRAWLDRPYSGAHFDGGESTDWEALRLILEGADVVLEGEEPNRRWTVRSVSEIEKVETSGKEGDP